MYNAYLHCSERQKEGLGQVVCEKKSKEKNNKSLWSVKDVSQRHVPVEVVRSEHLLYLWGPTHPIVGGTG